MSAGDQSERHETYGKLFFVDNRAYIAYIEKLWSSLEEADISLSGDGPFQFCRIIANMTDQKSVFEQAEPDVQADLLTTNKDGELERWRYRDDVDVPETGEVRGYITWGGFVAINNRNELVLRVQEQATDPTLAPRLVILSYVSSIDALHPDASEAMVISEIHQARVTEKSHLPFEEELATLWEETFLKYNLESPEFRPIWTPEQGALKSWS